MVDVRISDEFRMPATRTLLHAIVIDNRHDSTRPLNHWRK